MKIFTFLTLVIALMLIWSCSKTPQYSAERMNYLFANDGRWYLQEFTVNGRDSLPGHLRHSTMQKIPVDYQFTAPGEKKELGKIMRETDGIHFEIDKLVTAFSFTLPDYNGCLCNNLLGDTCVVMPFLVKTNPEKWNIVTLDEQVLELELNSDPGYRMLFTRSTVKSTR